jgi:serine/threonine protein kinase
METQIIDAAAGTQIITEGTQLASGSTTETGANFTGGLLQIHERVSGWEVKRKLATISGEADIYIADKNGKPGVIKYYRSVTKPKTEILDKLKELNHPDIVDVYDFGTYNDRFYEIMEYAEGGALDTRNDDKKRSYRYLPLSEEETVEICKEVINSFKTCHEMGIIHRDIKPANIYFRRAEEIGEADEDGKKRYKGSDAVIADFGISSVMDEAEQLHKTRTGSRTTGYAAPEVLSGLISPKMDYYALGITLWELLTGKDPFTTENGKRRNDAHLIRDTIEGRIADDILSKEPRVSQNMERLIRGLLVIDPEHRWGYDEVIRHLAGETVEIYQQAKKDWTFSIGETECTTLEDLGSALMDNIDAAKKYIFRRRLSAFLEDEYPDIAKKIDEIAEESSAKKDENNGVLRVAYLLNPGIPFKVDNGFKAQNLDDIIFLLENAPESLLSLFHDHKSGLYTWFEIIGNTDHAEEIKKLPTNISDTEFAGKAEVLLKNKVIKPFKLEKYKDFELSTLDQLRKVPGDMQRHILALVKEKSYEGLFLPWLYIATPNLSINNIDTSSWEKFIMCIT